MREGTEKYHEKHVSEIQGRDLKPGLPEYTQITTFGCSVKSLCWMELRHQLDISATFKTIKFYVMKGTCHIY
jgi:hypothetical protein